VSETYYLTQPQAVHVISLASGASQAAARHYARDGGDRKKLVEDTISFVIKGVEAFKA
jgi:hypothetical protein